MVVVLESHLKTESMPVAGLSLAVAADAAAALKIRPESIRHLRKAAYARRKVHVSHPQSRDYLLLLACMRSR
jgi:hypothetical protein